MPHRIEDLRQTLAELDRELEEIDSLDDQTREMLLEAHRDIEAALSKHQEEPIQPEEYIDPLTHITREFEESHPRLARIVGSLVNALAQLGI